MYYDRRHCKKKLIIRILSPTFFIFWFLELMVLTNLCVIHPVVKNFKIFVREVFICSKHACKKMFKNLKGTHDLTQQWRLKLLTKNIVKTKSRRRIL